MNPQAKWIWIDRKAEQEEYVYFTQTFSFSGASTTLFIAAETDYVAYVNGLRAGFGQFPGFPHEKYYDEIDITPFCHEGENELSMTVRYEGINSATHINDGAGVIFSIESGGKLLAASSAATRAGYDTRYLQHHVHYITGQLGLSSTMQIGKPRTDRQSVEIEKPCHLKKRPVKKSDLLDFVKAAPLGRRIYDLGREMTGYLRLKVHADKECTVKVAFGEYLLDSHVNYNNAGRGRDYSLDFIVTPGDHEFEQFFIRLGLRYLEVIAPEDVMVSELGVIPSLYPITEKKATLELPLDQSIYDVCVRTLRLCMNHHYEDCPWREQALYVLDSRNQMLCGYYTFKETDFARENLLLMAKGVRRDGFLELTTPAIETPAIPFFSAMYAVLVHEYVEHTGDTGVLAEVLPVIRKIMKNFSETISPIGLIAEFQRPFWNFYEWTPGSDGDVRRHPENEIKPTDCHLILNCAYVYAADRAKKLFAMAGEPFDIDTAPIKDAIVRELYNEKTGLFSLSTYDKNNSSQLGNAFALLIGLGDERTVKAIKSNTALIPATLSMLIYVYEALLAHDAANADYILADIRQKYGYMLDNDATSFWETLDGLDLAGSRCHGWSALPAYFYHKLGLVK